MALWGNNDNVGSGGTVSLDYSTRIVTGFNGVGGAAGEAGSGTTFGQTGFAKTGDTISFGQHGSGTYFGDAVNAGIGSTTQITIASTAGLSGDTIAGAEYTISEKPTWCPTDTHWSAVRDTAPTINKLTEGTTTGATGIGSLAIEFDISAISPPVQVGDYLVNGLGLTDGTENFEIKAIGYSTAVAIATCITDDKVFRAEPPDWITPGTTTVGLGTTRPIVNQVGFVTADVGGSGVAIPKGSLVVPVKEILTYHLMVGDVVNIGAAITDVAIASIAHTTVSLASTTPVNINVGTMISFSSSTFNVFASAGANNDETIAIGDSITYGEGQFATREFPSGGNDVIQIDEALVSAITSGLAVTFRRSVNGYDAYVYGVSGIGASSALASSKSYITEAGWVGVTTYLDNLGNLRVKKETLVAMSGITTGNAPAYPPEYDA